MKCAIVAVITAREHVFAQSMKISPVFPVSVCVNLNGHAALKLHISFQSNNMPNPNIAGTTPTILISIPLLAALADPACETPVSVVSEPLVDVAPKEKSSAEEVESYENEE